MKILAIAFVLATLLTACGTAPTEAPTAQPTPTPITGKWITEVSQSEFDDSKTVLIYLDADDKIKDWQGNEQLPRLSIRCQEKALHAWFDVGMPPDSIASDGYVYLRVRYDQDEADKASVMPSTDGEVLDFKFRTKETIMTMMEHTKLLVGYTPYKTDEVSFSFDLTGLNAAIVPVLEICPYFP